MLPKLSKILAPIALFSSITAFALPNPAAVKCIELGGENVSMQSSAGAVGLCKLGSALISQWTLLHYVNGNEQEAVAAYLDRPNHIYVVHTGHLPIALMSLPNPASEYCTKVAGGELENVSDERGASALCKFKDNSSIEEWTLFKGPKDVGHTLLNEILNIDTAPPPPDAGDKADL